MLRWWGWSFAHGLVGRLSKRCQPPGVQRDWRPILGRRVAQLVGRGKAAVVRYDLELIGRSVSRSTLAARAPDFWRYRELLPIRKAADVVSLGEEMTPLVPLAETSRRIGGGEVMVKDEGRLPTASFKARGMAVAISMAKSFGVRQMALPTVGSGGASLAAYCRRASIEGFIFCPEDSPQVTMREIAAYGARFTR